HDPAWGGADSAIFVERAREIAAERGFRIANVDSLVIAEEPQIAPRASEMRARIAALLALGAEAVSVRGTSSNGLGFAGRGEGIAAMAVVLLEGKDLDADKTNRQSR